MLVIPILILTVVAMALALVRPKWGAGLTWLVLFTYPHNWWFNHPFLPLNIGADDLFCIVLFLSVVVRRNLFGGVPVRWGYGFWVITTFALVVTVATLSGALDAPFDRLLYLKDILKIYVYWGLFYAILHCIDDGQDLRRMVGMFALAALVGGALVLLQHFLPGRMQDWSNPSLVEIEEVTGRASGAFLNPNGAACVLACSLVLVVTALRLQESWISKALLGLSCGFLLLGVLVTRSRSGLLALGVTFGLMALVGRNKKVAWMVIASAIVVGLSFGGVREAFRQRLATVYDPTAQAWTANVAGRTETWLRYFQTATPKVYLLGQGQRAGILRNGSETHSAYVSALTVYGLAGVVWAIASAVGLWRKACTGRRPEGAITAIVQSGCLWAWVAWAVYAATSDALSSQYPRYLLLLLVVLVDRASAIARDAGPLDAWDEVIEEHIGACEETPAVTPEA
jgi:hypothetical protein